MDRAGRLVPLEQWKVHISSQQGSWRASVNNSLWIVIMRFGYVTLFFILVRNYCTIYVYAHVSLFHD